MAKRKRLDVNLDTVSPEIETKSPAAAPRARMPIADVAAEVAGRAALEEVAREMTRAEEEGRVVKNLPLAAVERHHLSRDRMVIDPEEMEALQASIAARGQQTPIEVVRLAGGRYGLISGLRRMEALRALGETHVLALVKSPDSSQAAYQAMVEENEMRADLSFYERAHIAVAAVGQGVFEDPRAAIRDLFAHAPRAKRSKINKFVLLIETLGQSLRFPTAIPEHLGMRLGKAIADDREVAVRIAAALRAADPQEAAAERQVLEQALTPPTPVASPRAPEAEAPVERREIAPGLRLEARAGRVVLSGERVDEDFIAALKDWAGV